MAQNKKQHYLGQAYLKGFADRKRRDAIWQFRASTNEVRLTGISNVGQRSYFYSTEDPSGNRDHSIERWFSRVESWWPSLLAKISSNLESISTGNRALRITDDDRVRILQYVLIHLLRVPRSMEWMRRYVEERHPRRSVLTDREVHNLRVRELEYTHDDMVYRWIEFLDARELTIEAVPAGSRVTLFTSDNPVIVFNPEGTDGIAYETTHIVFPVTRRSFIRWAGKCTTRNAIMVKVYHDREFIDGLNRHLIETATDEIYSSNSRRLHEILGEIGYRPILRRPAE